MEEKMKLTVNVPRQSLHKGTRKRLLKLETRVKRISRKLREASKRLGIVNCKLTNQKYLQNNYIHRLAGKHNSQSRIYKRAFAMLQLRPIEVARLKKMAARCKAFLKHAGVRGRQPIYLNMNEKAKFRNMLKRSYRTSPRHIKGMSVPHLRPNQSMKLHNMLRIRSR
jgi:hypothetical protein